MKTLMYHNIKLRLKLKMLMLHKPLKWLNLEDTIQEFKLIHKISSLGVHQEES
jgi:hypothetical protein